MHKADYVFDKASASNLSKWILQRPQRNSGCRPSFRLCGGEFRWIGLGYSRVYTIQSLAQTCPIYRGGSGYRPSAKSNYILRITAFECIGLWMQCHADHKALEVLFLVVAIQRDSRLSLMCKPIIGHSP